MSKKLLIRINNPKDIEANDSYAVTEETVIRWDRVISVAMIAILTVGALVTSGWYFLNTETPEHTIASAVDSASVDENAHQDIAAKIPDVEAGKVEVDTAEEKVVDGANILGTGSVAVSDEADVVEVVEPQNAIEPQTVEADEVIPNPLPFVDPVVIDSNRIVNAQLTHTLKKNRPVEPLSNTVSMKGDKLIKVYLYTGMEGLKGETLYHDWYLSGKRMARVKMNVRSDSTSASSSKFIDQYMMGDWRVTVTTRKGDQLVSAQFNVIP